LIQNSLLKSGTKYGRWTVIEMVSRLVGQPKLTICVCECGTHGLVRIRDLITAQSSSCGCLKRERSLRKMSHRHTALQWRRMWRLKRLGLAEICDDWKSFATFAGDLGMRPRGMVLVRLDEREAFNRENCRWADRRNWKSRA